MITTTLKRFLDGNFAYQSAVWSKTTEPNDTLTITLSDHSGAPKIRVVNMVSLYALL